MHVSPLHRPARTLPHGLMFRGTPCSPLRHASIRWPEVPTQVPGLCQRSARTLVWGGREGRARHPSAPPPRRGPSREVTRGAVLTRGSSSPCVQSSLSSPWILPEGQREGRTPGSSTMLGAQRTAGTSPVQVPGTPGTGERRTSSRKASRTCDGQQDMGRASAMGTGSRTL